ncbi:hypothetical protein KKA95_02925, partial [Patescibacteria group bacterium]|nr:hypothetical protein [Patescibacteria group bacterium]
MTFNDESWKKLESKLPAGERISACLIFPELSRRLYAGLDSSKQRHLLIPLSENEEEYNDSKSRGLTITTRDLVVLGFEVKRYIDITCHEDSGYIVFDIIGKEIAEKLDSGKSKEVIA